MIFVDLPGTEEKVSALGLGTWVFGGENWGGAKEEESLSAIQEAIASGMTFIDTAPFYGNGLSEALIGRAIQGCREKVFIATKCGVIRENGRIKVDLSPYSVKTEVDLSLKRLQCDVIDLYQCHWPDESLPIEKTMETLLGLQKQGKIRHIGVSNFDLGLLRRAVKVAPVRTLQMPYSLLDRRIELYLLPFCLKNKVGVIVYGALGGGILTGKYDKLPNFDKRDARRMFYNFYESGKFKNTQAGVQKVKDLGHPLNQLALNWVRQQPGMMTILAGCRSPRQVKDNVASVGWDLTAQELKTISQIKF